MLSERQYARFSSGDSYQSGRNSVYILIAITVVTYFLLPVQSKIGLYQFALSSYGIERFKFWQFITYMFMHGGLTHILFNMYGLYLFGTTIISALGTPRFLTLYFLSGVSGAGLWLLFNWGSRIPVVGASAGVFGVMMAAAMLYPDMRIQLLFPPIPMKMKTFAIVFAGIELVNELSNVQGGVAHLAHLGGFISAYFYLKWLYGDQVSDMFSFLKFHRRKNVSRTKVPKNWKVYSNPATPDYEPVSKEEVNRILDKISAQGMNSLTQEEKNTLQRASDEMKKKT